MAKSLVITEKPSVARDIVDTLGGFTEHDGYWENDEYVVTFSVGHILELLSPEDVDPQYKRWVLDTLPILPEEFKLKKKAGHADRHRIIKKLLERKDVSEVINACDAGREGELIFREILQFLGNPKPHRRLWLQSMTKAAIRQGFSALEPGADYDNLGAAAACRSQSDWLIGMNATRALTRRLKSRKEKTAWSAGRVQTPTLALVVERELEVLSHIPKAYSRLEARFEAAGHEYAGSWFDPAFSADEQQPERRDDRIFDEAEAQTILERVQGQAGSARETRKPSRETAPPLFDLTSLQREANRRFSWSARRTLNAAQRCYEGHKILTYPRTSSRALPEDYRETVDEVLVQFAASSDYGELARGIQATGLENTERTFDDSKVSDHFAIIPTGTLPEAPLSGDDARLFELVVRRFLGNFMPPALWNRVERITEVAGASFRTRSRTLEEPGWRAALGQAEHESEQLPPLVAGQSESDGIGARTLEIERIDEQTKPPPRYTEARLLSLMENAGREIEDEDAAEALRDKGIGTSATRADIIENLIAKGYLVRGGGGLRPTVKGIRLVDVLQRIHIDRLASAKLTGELEHHLLQVERGERTARSFMEEIEAYTRAIVKVAQEFDYKDLYKNDPPIGKCPLCSRLVYEYSWFYRCEEQPEVPAEEDCPFRIWKDKAGRYIDRATASTLLEKGETGELEGFSSRDGRIYGGILKLEDDGQITLTSVAGSTSDRTSDNPEYEVDERPLGPCPMGCGSQVIETSTHFICRAGYERAQELEREREALVAKARAEGKKRPRIPKPEQPPCPFILPRTVCKREITRDEALAYIADKRTGLLPEFTSRFGRPFSATLVLKDSGRHGFEFAPREKKGAKADAAEGDEGQSPSEAPPTKKASQRKTAAKKTTTKKKAAKKKATKKTARKKSAAKKTSTKKATSRAKSTPQKASPKGQTKA